MRILFLAWRDLAHPQAGGSESMVDRLALGAIERGHQVALVCGGPVGRRPYPVVDAGGKYTQYLRAPFVARRRFRGYDLVVDVENGIPFFSPLWWSGPVVCLVHHVHGPQWRMHFGPLTAAFGSFLERQLMPRAYRRSTFCAVSPWTAAALEELGIDRSRISIVPPGIDFPEPMTDRREPDEPLFLALGRLVPHKRIDLLLRAWERVRPVTGGRLVVAGDGPERDRLSSLATAGVEIRGRISEDEKSELFATAWLLLHPALHEGWGSGIIEAAAHGLPALGFDVPGVRDAIVGGETGELAHDEDEFVRRWQELATDGPRRRRLGVAARERAAQFQWKTGVEKLLRVAEEATAPRQGGKRSDGIRRTLAFLTAFRHEATDPGQLYHLLAADIVGHLERHIALEGRTMVDIGGGPGYLAEAAQRVGARCVTVDSQPAELELHGRQPTAALVGDGCHLPIPDASVDVVCSSNVLEHVVDPFRLLNEQLRVVRPGGLVYLAFTNWYSPWGGHETSPWHYVGGEFAVKRYQRRYGRPPKNRFGRSLYPVHIASVLRWVRHNPAVDVLEAYPRYYPAWTRPVVAIPGLREFATWNLALTLRKRP